MTPITVDQLHEKSKKLSDGEVILDVRSPEEFAEGHIRGAVNVPHTDIADYEEELRKYKTFYVHCRMGGRAVTAAQELARLGFSNVHVANRGGMEEWKQKKYEMA
jgi:rhodanese-related sulfurtransferase